MRRIRKLNYFDKKNAEKMISFLNDSSSDAYTGHIMFNPLVMLHYLLPLKLKFLPESYVLKEKNTLKGLITVVPSRVPSKKMEIQKLLFEENDYDSAIELITYAVSKYKAMGTASFIVRIDDFLPELIKLFVLKCGFSQLSYEKLWHITQINQTNYDFSEFREFRNTDASVVSSLYNESLLPHFRPLLSKDIAEFKEIPCKGLTYFSEYKFIIEENVKSKNILGCVIIKTSDNENFIIHLIQSSWVNIDINKVIAFANSQIKKRKKKFNLFIKTKKYVQNSENLDNEFINLKYDCIQNKAVLTNSSVKIIKSEEFSGKFTVLNQFCTGIRVIN